MPKQETFYYIIWEVNKSGNEIRPVYVILQKKNFYQKLYEKFGLVASFRPFLIFKESPAKRKLRKSVS